MANILIIDDHRETSLALVRLFNSSGHVAHWESSGTEALRYVRNAKPDFVLLDFMMPDMDGLDTLRKLRGTPTTAHVPITIYTAVSDGKFREFAIECGATDVWTKGQLDFNQMLKRLNETVH
jgi:CheY-like chemotaxis protein